MRVRNESGVVRQLAGVMPRDMVQRAVGLIATTPAAVGVGVAGGYIVSSQVMPHLGQGVQEFGP